jgi:tetratricopeptide (TPR) repeat protein
MGASRAGECRIPSRSRRQAGRSGVERSKCTLLVVGVVLVIGSVTQAATPTNGQSDAMDGPWLWLEPDLGSYLLAPSLSIGPWRELAVSRDHMRREDELAGLALSLDVDAPTSLDPLSPDPLDAETLIDDANAPTVRAAILERAANESGRLLEAAGEWKAAAEAYESVVESDDLALVETWHGLALSRARSGDAAGAEEAFLRGLDASGPASVQIRFRFDLAGFYARQGRLLEAQAVLTALAPHVPDAELLQAALGGIGTSIELTALQSPRGMPAEWPLSGPDRAWEEYDSRLSSAVSILPESTRSALLPVFESFGEEEGRQAILVGASLVVTVLALFVLFRQRGDVAIALGYPEELRGIFRIRIRNGHRAPPDASTESQIRKGGASTRKEHQMVSRETQFQRLFTGRYHVIVDGLLLDPETDEVLGKIHEEKILRVRHRRTTRLEFDVHPNTCPVDLEVVWGDRPAHEAQITVPGFVEKPRRTSAGGIRIMLPKGNFRLLIGCGDRVFDQPLEVTSCRPTPMRLDVLEAEPVFKGCPPAVEPYLKNDLAGVARALERDGQAELGFRLLATMHQADGESGRAADLYESAGDVKAAARLRLEQGESGRAAALFEQAQEWVAAAAAHKQDGAVLQAGECYERALDYERAIECYRECGAIDRWLTALERCGRDFEAAKLAIDHDQRPRAIRLLQRVEPTDDDFREACGLLAEAFETEGHYDLAAGKLDEFISTFRPAYATGDTYARVAELWEQAGHLERALDVLEDLRRREPTFPNIAARIESLRKQRSASGHLFNSGRISSGRTSDGAATAFVDDVRYELIEEIGRGGMGIVYRALDTRLDRIVALKRLPEGLRRHHPRALQFFLREAQSAARLNHANIVTVYDADQQDGHFFITMELLEGSPLQTVLRDRGQLSPINILGIARQVCRGLDYAHVQSVIHRDIKTANLFVTAERVVKIMDFGLAKVLEEVRGATTLVSGTPYYMSPEQVLGGDVDHRTDLYSLGVTLFELATGSVPFDSGEVAYHHRHTPVPDPRELRTDLPPDLAHLILKLLNKSPDDRFQSAREVLDIVTQIESQS